MSQSTHNPVAAMLCCSLVACQSYRPDRAFPMKYQPSAAESLYSETFGRRPKIGAISTATRIRISKCFICNTQIAERILDRRFCVPLSALIIVPNSLGYVGDERVPEERRGIDWELLRSNRYIIFLCLVVAACAVVNALIDLVFFDAHLAQMIYALSCTVSNFALKVLGCASNCSISWLDALIYLFCSSRVRTVAGSLCSRMLRNFRGQTFFLCIEKLAS